MLVLSRRLNEKIILPGIPATIQVVNIKPGTVRIGIDAPPGVTILREEVHDRQAEWAAPAVAPAPEPAPTEEKLLKLLDMVRNRLRIGGIGLDVLRKYVQSGQVADAETILGKIEEDFQLLRQRLEGPAPAAKQRRSRKALLVEDNANERELLAAFLRSSGLDVATAGDGADALDYLHAGGQADVVLLDMGLPRCDGATTVREIRNDPAYAGLKIFAVTGRSPEEFGGRMAVDRWFRKPIDPNELMRNVQSELEV